MKRPLLLLAAMMGTIAAMADDIRVKNDEQLRDALNNDDTSTVILTKDITAYGTYIGGNKTLDLNGKTLTLISGLYPTGTLTIKDGTIINKPDSYMDLLSPKPGSNTTIKDCTFINDYNSGTAIFLNNEAEGDTRLTIESGYFQSRANTLHVQGEKERCTVTINGGTFVQTEDYGQGALASPESLQGSITINGGTFFSTTSYTFSDYGYTHFFLGADKTLKGNGETMSSINDVNICSTSFIQVGDADQFTTVTLTDANECGATLNSLSDHDLLTEASVLNGEPFFIMLKQPYATITSDCPTLTTRRICEGTYICEGINGQANITVTGSDEPVSIAAPRLDKRPSVTKVLIDHHIYIRKKSK